MGCDGGTIPKRDELVRTKKKPEKKDKQSELSFKWGHCSITQEALQKPIVACQLGRLYSKTSVIVSILNKALPDSCKHIKSIKDVKELNLTENPAFQEKAKTGDSYNDSVSQYICPVIGLEMTGKFRFIFFWTCGCVMSERSLKAVNLPTKICHKCQTPYSNEDIIILNGEQEDIDRMQVKMEARQALIKAEKKSKKAAKKSEEDPQPSTSASTEVPSTSTKPTSKLAVKRSNPVVTIEDPVFKKTKSTYSVAKDPKATEVFKSLFTSHKTAEQQTRAHWITYNPFYN